MASLGHLTRQKYFEQVGVCDASLSAIKFGAIYVHYNTAPDWYLID